ncbi:MAG: glycine betaine ABC transporter substrate-binding protein [Planctomycetota bacterium]
MSRAFFAVLACLPLADDVGAQGGQSVVVGSKNFTESCILAELMVQMIEEHTDLAVERRINLGGTMICWSALQAGAIDLYADYTGTGWAIILKEQGKITDPLRAFFHVRRRYREEYSIRWLEPFGLNNTYALAMDEAKAAQLGIVRISDLLPHAKTLKAGFSIEFMNREDGYRGLAQAYGLELGEVRSLEHGLAYTAIRSGDIDLIDAYSTDGKLLRYKLRVLEDDRRFFPPYNAAPIVREETLRAHPELEAVLNRLAFRLPDRVMQSLNYVVEAEAQTFADTARAFLERESLVDGERADAASARAALERVLEVLPGAGRPKPPEERSGFFDLMSERAGETLRLVAEHIGLTLVAVLLAAAVAIPLGIAITKYERPRQVALGAAGVVQTIPSLALLAFMIPFLGLGIEAAIAALFLYAVLPILRNTYTGIVEVDADLLEAARGMGMRPRQILTRVQLPLAMRTLMAGIRTSTVISIGVATLAAFIGAGGLGEPIVTGLYLDDTNLIMTGAVPAAALAILADVGLGRLELALQPRTQSAPA